LTYSDLIRRAARAVAVSLTAFALTASATTGASAFHDSGGVGTGGDTGAETGDTGGDTGGEQPTSSNGGRFPILGSHTYGDGLGAGRGHQGQDLLAKCGKRVVAAQPGRVQLRDYHGAAGNYVVIDGKGGRDDLVYMHLKKRAKVGKGERVRAGQTIGRVGDTGNAAACHLHFEIWSDPGYYEGGKPVDPEPQLRRWDKGS
jgi:murein DD-endopeptidase MepM/ murein hydrolase activator NlpD